jgi:hypothetical protein
LSMCIMGFPYEYTLYNKVLDSGYLYKVRVELLPR